MSKLENAILQALHSPTRGQSVDADLSPAFTIWHTGAPHMSGSTETAVTAATIEWDTGDDMTFFINGAADVRLKATTGIVDCSTATGTFDSFLELYNKINNVPGWCMRIDGGLMADLIDDTTRNVLVVSASTDCFQTPVQFYWDTSNTTTTSRIAGCISNRRIIEFYKSEQGYDVIGMMEDEGGATNVLESISVNSNDAGTTPSGTLTIYSCNGKTRTDTLLATQVVADSATETYDFTKCGGITALPGERLVVKFISLAGAADSATVITTFRLNGHSIGGRWTV